AGGWLELLFLRGFRFLEAVMGTMSRNQTVGVMTLLGVATGIIGFTALKSAQTSPVSPITLKEPAVQPPASPSREVLTTEPVHPGNTSPDSAGPPNETAVEKPAEVVIHVAGAVKKPGLYHLPAGARNDDAVKAAGGATGEANLDGINLAARCEDGIQLY